MIICNTCIFNIHFLTEAVCTFPTDMVGRWHVSDFGGAVIQRKTLTTEKSVVNFGTRIFECTVKENNRYLLTYVKFNLKKMISMMKYNYKSIKTSPQ